jgi:hypothetical protein
MSGLSDLLTFVILHFLHARMVDFLKRLLQREFHQQAPRKDEAALVKRTLWDREALD